MEPSESAEATTVGPLAAILITPVLQVIRLANETLERRMADIQAHLVEVIGMRQAHLLDKLAEADVRYQQRFQAQSEALTAAFLAQQTAMQTALVAAEKAVTAALAAADRAVTKAEIASEKRFESVNEFRAVLTEQSKMLMTRSEFETAIRGLADKMTQQNELLYTTTAALDKRVTLQEGRREGIGSSWGILVAVVGLLLTAMAMMYAMPKGH